MRGQFVDINAAVAQDTGFAVDPADTGSSGYDAFKAFRRRGGGGHVVPRLLQVGLAARAREGTTRPASAHKTQQSFIQDSLPRFQYEAWVRCVDFHIPSEARKRRRRSPIVTKMVCVEVLALRSEPNFLARYLM